MGLECPVCPTVHPDREHLANHLAFTALFGDDDHERWLDRHVSDWGTMNPRSLGDRVEEFARERPIPVGKSASPTGSDRSHGRTVRNRPASAGDDEVGDILDAARALSREMLAGDDRDPDGAEESNDDR